MKKLIENVMDIILCLYASVGFRRWENGEMLHVEKIVVGSMMRGKG